jgi:membrane-anchored glycerophosphoryl diester phosphodiesterase (GDPDase)
MAMKGGFEYAMKDGWETMKKDLVNNIIVFFVASLLSYVAGLGIVSMFYCAHKLRSGEKITIADALWGLKNNPVRNIIAAVVFAVPFCLCYLPGLYLGPQWIYMFPMIARGDQQDGIAAMKASWEKAKAGGFMDHFIRFLLIGIVGGIGSVLCGIGALITMPIAIIAFDAAYDDFKA